MPDVNGYRIASDAIEVVGPVHPSGGGAVGFQFEVTTRSGKSIPVRYGTKPEAEKQRQVVAELVKP